MYPYGIGTIYTAYLFSFKRNKLSELVDIETSNVILKFDAHSKPIR
jgi:hypothetical protein